MNICRWATITLTIILSACGSTKALEPVSPAGGDRALVYFIRQNYPPYIYTVKLSINGKEAAAIVNNDYVAVNVPVGKNSVFVDILDGKPMTFDMPVEKAENMYVVLTRDVTKAGQAMTAYNQFTVYLNWDLRAFPVTRADAEAIVSKFRRKLK